MIRLGRNKKKWHCYSCNRDSTNWNDFKDCIEKKHEVLQVLLGKEHESKDNRTDSKKLYDVALGLADKIVVDESNRNKVYAVIENNGHTETFDLASTKAKNWLSYESRKLDSDQIHSEDFYKNVLHAITSDAIMNGTLREKIYRRVAQLNDEIYYDLGVSEWIAVKINKKKIGLVSLDHLCPLFVRAPSLQEQVLPKFNFSKNPLDELADLLLVLDKDRIVFKANVVALFLQRIPVPIPVIDGEAGSIKTTFISTLQRIVDPNGKSQNDNHIILPAKPDDLDAIFSNRYMISFDNVSTVDQAMSDKLCMSITGGSSAGRKLYTNSEESLVNYRNKITINGIVPKLEYPDLQTRILRYPRKDLDSVPFITDKKFEEIFQKLLPSLLGQIFKALQKAMKIYSRVSKEINPLTRMADFEVWGEAIIQSLGYEKNTFQQSYMRKLEEDVLNAKDYHIVAQIIDEMMQEREKIEETISTLHTRIKMVAVDQGIPINSKFVYFPLIPNQLSRELKVITPLLKRLGYRIETYIYHNRDKKFPRNSSIVKITKKLRMKNDWFSTPSGKDNDKDGKDEQNHPYQQKPKIRHENRGGRDDKDDKDVLHKLGVGGNTKPYFFCRTCDAGIFHISEESKSSGSILDFHKKAGHAVEFFTKKRAKLERDSRRNLFG